MTRTRLHLVLLAATLGAAGGAFWITRSADARQAPRVDNTERITILRERLRTERQKLAMLFNEPDNTDGTIADQAERTITAHADLFRAALQGVVSVRPDLPPEQRQTWIGLCGSALGRGCGMGHGGMGMGLGRGQRHRRGEGHGTGMGMGLGPGRGGCHRRLALHLALDEEQSRTVYNLDPAFDSEVADLLARLQDEHRQLAALLSDSTSAATALEAQGETLLQARRALEQRMVDHVLLLRLHLDPEQQERLIGLCTREDCPRD